MRPISIKMTAFGPFAGTEEVDFTQLGRNPLFLINGPTGSGKTTILDAICFALYGETTGADRDGREMRCDHATADELTAVEFVFELGETLYRVYRIPEQERQKVRGEGTTKQAAEAQLYKTEKDGEEQLLVARKVGDANREVVGITGLSSEQFRQIMVLPQGKFREFLLADSASREKIFTTLFQTEIYSRLEARLKENAINLAKQVRALKDKQEGMLEPVGVESAEALLKAIDKWERKLNKAGTKKEKAEKALQKAQRAATAARGLEDSFTSHDKAAAILSTLLKQAGKFGELAETLARAKKASELRPAHANKLVQEKVHQEAHQASTTCAEALAAAAEALESAEEQWGEAQNNQPRLEGINKQLVTLEGHRDRVARLAAARQELDQLSSQQAEASQAADGAREKLAAAQQTVARLDSEREAISQDAIAFPTRQAVHAQVTSLLRVHTELAGHRAEQARLSSHQQVQSGELRQAEKELNIATDRRKAIENAWGDGQAAILAGALADGEPCPVCGSTEHPLPAASAEALPSAEDLDEARSGEERARDKSDQLRRSINEAGARLKEIEKQLTRAQETLGDQASTPQQDLEKQLADLDAELQTLKDAAFRLQQHTTAQEAAGLVRKQAEAASQAADTALQGLVTREAAAQQGVKGIEAELPEPYRQTGALEVELEKQQRDGKKLADSIEAARKQREEAVNASATATARLDSARGVLEKAAGSNAKAAQGWEQALLASEFNHEKDFNAALLNPAEATDLDKELREFEDQKLIAGEELKSTAVAIKGKQRPDMVAAQAAEQVASEKAGAATAKFHRRENRRRQLGEVLEKLNKSRAEQQALEERYKLVGTLSNVANGQNQYRTSLQRFVLGVLLDDVLREAGQKLHSMSRGRYQLRRRGELADRRSQAGLDLVVDDAYTGKERGVSTLSGGESFMAALALALGLSAVVQAYAGGIRLETLFIDEGFGSLDTESLDLAINTLLELQSAGIMVGVISHVGELKERIDVRLDLTTSQQGSHVQVVVP